MKKLLLAFFLSVGFYNLLAQKVINDPNVEKRSVGSFHGIEVATGIKLFLSEGETEEVAVSAASAEYRDKIITKVENGILKIHYDSRLGAINRKKTNKKLTAYVSYKTLDRLNANTGAQVEINGVLRSNGLTMHVNTGAIVRGEVDVPTLTVDQNTGSRITLSGKAVNFDADGDTGSNFTGESLTTTNCTVSMSTGASITITVEKELSAKANTGGKIRYKGSAGIRSIKTNTGGNISKI